MRATTRTRTSTTTTTTASGRASRGTASTPRSRRSARSTAAAPSSPPSSAHAPRGTRAAGARARSRRRRASAPRRRRRRRRTRRSSTRRRTTARRPRRQRRRPRRTRRRPRRARRSARARRSRPSGERVRQVGPSEAREAQAVRAQRRPAYTVPSILAPLLLGRRRESCTRRCTRFRWSLLDAPARLCAQGVGGGGGEGRTLFLAGSASSPSLLDCSADLSRRALDDEPAPVGPLGVCPLGSALSDCGNGQGAASELAVLLGLDSKSSRLALLEGLIEYAACSDPASCGRLRDLAARRSRRGADRSRPGESPLFKAVQLSGSAQRRLSR